MKRNTVRALSSQIVKWATDGIIKIQPKRTRKFLFDFYETTLIKRKDLKPNATKAEHRLMKRLFKKESKVNLKKNIFVASNIRMIIKSGTTELKQHKIFDKKPKSETKRAWNVLLYMQLFYLVGLIFVPVSARALRMMLHLKAQEAIFNLNGYIALLFIYNLFFVSIATSIGWFFMRRLNKKGIKLFKELKGLYEYIKKAEASRIKYLNDPDKLIKHYEQLLPYAILFGLERKWTKVLKIITQDFDLNYTPAWVVNTGEFSMLGAPSLAIKGVSTNINTQIQRVKGQAWTCGSGGVGSSGGSSGGGGGFSGGSSSGGW